MTSWFDGSPETYDRARPSYPEPLWDALFAALPSSPRILEIGPGTGKATTALLSRGASVVGYEPGERLAAFLRARFGGESLEVRNAPFEAADDPPGSFDAVVAATSFHWVEHGARTAKAPAMLRPGGLLAVVGTHQVADSADRGYFAASHGIYRRYFPETPAEPETAPGRDLLPAELAELAANPLLVQARLLRFDWDQRYDTAAYLDLVRSYSNTAQLAPVSRERFLAELATFIDTGFDGFVIRPLVMTLSYGVRRA